MLKKFESKYYCADIENDKIKFLTRNKVILINNLRFSYSTCNIYNIRDRLTNPQEIALNCTTDLRPGDSILITNTMHGASALSTFCVHAMITSVKEQSIEIDMSLPPHIMRRSQGLLVMKRTGQFDGLPMSDLQILPRLGGASIVFKVNCEHFNMLVEILMSEENPDIEVRSKTHYLKNCTLFHQGIVIETPLALSQLHLKNRMLRTLEVKNRMFRKIEEPVNDVWLWQEGCRVGSSQAEWVVQHTPNIACIEVITRGKGFLWKTVTPTQTPQVIINMEHFHAQRYRRNLIPYDAHFCEFEEYSAPRYTKGDETNHSFKIFLGEQLPHVPRLMLTPKGFRAAHVWTEHADRTNINTHRAAYYGDERISHAEDAVGGFVKYGHVVTKSIFYTNKQSSACEISYTTDSAFRSFLDELDARGHEICAHALDPHYDNSPAEAYQAVTEIAKSYRSPTWIDHYYTHERSCITYEGLMPNSSHYMVDVWRANNIRYFWHAASEDFSPLKKDMIDLLHTSNGDYTPTPLYWRIPGTPADMITWAANECPLEYFKEEVIDALIKDRGISIHHHYYPYIEEDRNYSYKFIEKDSEQRYVATEFFNNILSIMAQRNREGELYFTTIGEIVSYWLALEHIQIELCIPDGFILTNTSDKMIEGFAFVIQAEQVSCSEAQIKSRSLDAGDILVWFDMPAQSQYKFKIL
jgi:hypothetical protein